MEDIEQLYITLRNSNLTNKSFEEFIQLYKDDDYKSRVHDAVVDKGLYSSDFNKFTSDYKIPVSVDNDLLKNNLSQTIKSIQENTKSILDLTTAVAEESTKGTKYEEQFSKLIKNAVSLEDTIPTAPTITIDEVITQDNYPGKIYSEEAKNIFASYKNNPALKPIYDKIFNQSQRYLGKSNPTVNGISIHAPLFAGNREDENKIEAVFKEGLDDRLPGLKDFLGKAYPDYQFKINVKGGASNVFGPGMFNELVMIAPNGEEKIITTGVEDSPDDIRFNVIDFVDKHGINVDSYESLYYEQDEANKNWDKILNPTKVGFMGIGKGEKIYTKSQQERIDEVNDPDRYKAQPVNFGIYKTHINSAIDYFGVDEKYKTKLGRYDYTLPNSEELTQARLRYNKYRNIANKNRPKNDQIPEATDEEIEKYAREYELQKLEQEFRVENGTNYLEEHEEERQAIERFYGNVRSDRVNLNAIVAERNLKLVTLESPLIKSQVNFAKRVLNGEFNLKEDETTTDVNYVQGNPVSQEVYDRYNKAVEIALDYDERVRIAEDVSLNAIDKVNDIDFQLDLLGRDYDTMAKFMTNVEVGFKSMGHGLAYGILGKGVQFVAYAGGVDMVGDAIGYKLSEKAAEFEDWKRSELDQYAHDVSFESAFDSWSSFGRFMAQETSTQIPILTSIIATGGYSPIMIGAYTFGEKYREMDAEDFKSGEFRSEWEKLGVSAGYSAFESILGTLPTWKILQRGHKYIKGPKHKDLYRKYSDAWKAENRKKYTQVLVYDPAIEALTESATTMGQNLLDGRPIMENTGHSAFSGGMLGLVISGGPVSAGMAMKYFQNEPSYKEYYERTKEISGINKLLEDKNLNPKVRKALENQKKTLEFEAESNLREIENLTLNNIGKDGFNRFNRATKEQEEIRDQAEEIYNTPVTGAFTNETKQKALKNLNEQFKENQFLRDLFRNHKSFGNEFALMGKFGNKAEKQRYQELKTEAENLIRKEKNKSPDFIPSNEDVMNKAYDLYIQDYILKQAKAGKSSTGIDYEVAQTNEDAKKLINESNISEDQKQKIIEGIDNGTLNGLDDGTIDGKSYVFMQNAVANSRTSTLPHETAHKVFKKIFGDKQADFTPMQKQIIDWLAKTDQVDLIEVINQKQTRNADPKIQAEEFIAEFLEQVNQGNIDFNKTDNKNLAALFGYMTTDIMSKDAGFELDLKGQADAVNFLVTLAAKLRTGTLTETDIKAAKESDVIKGIQTDVESKTGVKTSLESRTDETSGEKQKRQDKRNTDVAKIYDESAEGKTNKEWREFLDTPRGSRVLGNMINMYYPDMVASAIKNKAPEPLEVASESIEPLIKHIKAFNPQQNTDLAGYVGGYLGLKVGTGAKRVAAKTPTISMEKEGVREVAEKQAVEETATKETKPVREGIKLAERLGDDAKKISEKVKKMKPVLEGKTYKTLKDLAPDDTQRMFGITPKPGNLTKTDVKNAQAFIRKNADILLAMLPEGTTVGGKATGVQKVLLDAFYTKGRRVKAAKTGSKAGLATQTKRPDIKISEFLEVFGITPAGQPNVSDRNTSSRIKALVDQTGKLLTNQAIREVTLDAPKEISEGKSRVMFSEEVEGIIQVSGDFEGDVKNINGLLKQALGESIYKHDTKENIDEFFNEVENVWAPVLPKSLITKTVLRPSNRILKNKGKIEIDVDGKKMTTDEYFTNKRNEFLNKKIKYGKEFTGEGSKFKYGKNYGKYFGLTPSAINKANESGKIKQINKMHASMHKQLWQRINKSIRQDPKNAKMWGNYLSLVAQDTEHPHRMGAEMIGWSMNPKGYKGRLYEWEHAMPATRAYLYLMQASLMPELNFDVAYELVMNNFKLIALDRYDDNVKLKGSGRNTSMGQDWNLITDSWLKRYFDDPVAAIESGIDPSSIMGLNNKTFDQEFNIDRSGNPLSKTLIKSISDAKQKVDIPLVNESGVIKLSEDMSMEDVLNKAASLDEALRNARNPKAPVKKIRVFDFDDTLARTKSNVLYTMPDGTTGKLTAEEFAQRGDEMLAEGAVWDFSEFNKVMDGKKGPLFEVAKKIQDARGSEDIFVLTARAPEASPAIKEFLDAIGLNLPIENISGLGDSSPFAKSNWIVDKAAEGYNDFYFADDHMANVKAVRDALEVLDVKSKVQQAKIKFSEDMNMEFNTILEESKGVDRFKVFSDVKAKIRGARARRQRFFIPPSAEDFQGLLYPTLGKGKQGERHLEFYDKALFKPYAQAMENLATDRNNLMQDFKALKKDLDVPKDLRKQTESGFTNEQAVRVYLWNKTGQEIPGLSKTDLKELTDIIENDPKLKVFADQILSITKGDGYSKPGRSWQAGTITTDLIQILNEAKRAKYLETWQENVDIIFSKDNMNKLEAIFGPKYVEALKHSLARMKVGRNRIEGGNRLSNRVLDYINNSTGAIMFFNMRSALLQTISAANFINWSFNNPAKAGIAFANQPQYWKDFVKLMNSDYLTDRRNGLKLNINESEIADAAKTSKNKAKAVVSYIIEKGYIPTKFADSFAIATGGATFYRNRINDLIKNEGLSEAAAEKQAMQEFRKTSEISQQSSDPSRISQQQSTDLGRIILQFVNTPMQYARIQKRAIQDLANRRGDDKTNISKIAYYGIMQNLMFNALQSGLFALGFGAFGEEEENRKIIDVANGSVDSLLRGIGFAGITVQTLKNLGIDIFRRSKKDRPEYGDAWMKLLDFSPAIKSKVSKLRQAAYPFDSKKRRQEVFDKGFSLDNPAYESLAKVITAATNVPIDRLFSKVNNIKGALDEENETWQSIAMVLGWPGWQIKPKEKPLTEEQKKARNEANKIQRKKDAYKAAKGSTDYDTLKKLDSAQQIKMLKSLGYGEYTIKKAKSEKEKIDLIIYKNSGGEIKVNKKEEDQAKYKALNKDEQVAKLDSLGLSKDEIKALKYEKDRVKKLLELMEK